MLFELIDSKFNLENCDKKGNSILHYAVTGGNLEIIKFLVEVGGLSPAWANQELVTPYDLAHKCSLKTGGIAEIELYFSKVCGFAYEECYRNPVRRGMHPDPGIVRVGEDYYMVNSSFIFFPAIPISHSRDLVNWEVIGHAITDPWWGREHLGPLEGGRGLWAPDISYHNGRFYICATLRLNDDAPCPQTQLVTSAERPEGPYGRPVIHQVPGIDPSLFTDDDGRRYMLLNRGARIMEISEDGSKCLSKPQMIWYGFSKHAPEGPHLLKKDGYYYCFLAEGGTGKGHMETVARSRNLYGPYESCPYNPILHQPDEAGALQCCGHGKPVSTPDGRWFMVYLCSRLLSGKWGILGRETALDEIVWTPDGWPVIKGGKPSTMAPVPFYNREAVKAGKKLMRQKPRISGWMAPRTIDPRRIQVEADGLISITGDGRDLCDRNCRSLLVRWQPEFNFEAEFAMFLPPPDEQGVILAGSEAGITLYYDENTFIKFGLTEHQVVVKEYIDNRYTRVYNTAFAAGGESVRLKVVTAGLRRRFYLNDNLVCSLNNVTCLCSEGLMKGKRFTGAAYGVYVYGKDRICWRQYRGI